MQLFLISLFSAFAQAFQVGVTLKPQSPPLRTTAPAMFAPGAELATLPTIATIAEGDADGTLLLLASGGLIGFIFLFLVVGTVVTNFGIMKK